MATSSASQDVSKKLNKLMAELQTLRPVNATNDLFQEVCAKAIAIPASQRPPALLAEISRAFGRSDEEVGTILRVRSATLDFEDLMPSTGWIKDYVEWTRTTEPPTVFHFFSAVVSLGASLGRNVFFDKGAYKVYPNFCVMLIAPSGRCRKTSCANLGTSLYIQGGGVVLADKATPEALIDALQESAIALLYAPELAVFLGKQKYQEGMIPLLTALFDSPKEFTTKTIGRGTTVLMNVALSAIMCTTLDWLQTAVPSDAFGGGFMSRFLFVVQETTPRCFPLPPPLNKEKKDELIKWLRTLPRIVKGEISLSKKARSWYEHWYRTSIHNTPMGERLFSGYFERKPDHVLRLAIALRISQDPTTTQLEEQDLIRANKILDWLEKWLPHTFDQLASSAAGVDHGRILKQLRAHGGIMEHSDLLRRNSSRMNAGQFKQAIGTLREAKYVEWDATSRTYVLTSTGWGSDA
jgi:hypothetical protein